MNLKAGLEAILAGLSLSRAQAAEVMGQLVEEATPSEQIAAVLIALRTKGETHDEILGFIDALEKRSVRIPLRAGDGPFMDVCGTGGDGSGTFNVSTAVSLVLAASGQRVAKHGNRSVSSRSGSFDVLKSLGLPTENEPAAIAAAMRGAGIGFLFAPRMHPALAKVAAVRRSLGVYTVFNALGPLLNPVSLSRQLVGVNRRELMEVVAEVLASRGLEDAMVVRGRDGLDELTLATESEVIRVRGGKLERSILSPEDFGLTRAPLTAVQGAGPEENAEIIRDILRGASGPKRDLVVLNAAAALVVAGKASDYRAGAELARAILDDGRALRLLERLGREARAGEAVA